MGCFAPDPPAAVIRDPNAEASATLLSQLKAERGIDEFAPVGKRIDIEREYRPQYTQLAIDDARNALYGNNGNNGVMALLNQVAPEAARIQQAGLSAQRAGDIADVASLAGSARSAYDQLNPEGAALLRRRNEIAQQELDAGYGLTDSQQRQAQQAVRAAQAARGLGMGPTDAFTEALYLGDRGRQQFGERLNLADRTIGMNQSFYGDPFQQILGRPSGANPQGYLSQAQGYASGPVFNPHAYDALYDFNANAQNAANIAGANASAGIMGAGLGALGSIGGGLLGGGLWGSKGMLGKG